MTRTPVSGARLSGEMKTAQQLILPQVNANHPESSTCCNTEPPMSEPKTLSDARQSLELLVRVRTGDRRLAVQWPHIGS